MPSPITPAAARKLHAQLGVHLRYLNRLCARMQRLGFPPDDPLLVAAIEARARMQDLSVAAHYASCTSGVYREPD